MVEQEREARIQSEIGRIRQLFRKISLETEEGETSLREALQRLEAVQAEWTNRRRDRLQLANQISTEEQVANENGPRASAPPESPEEDPPPSYVEAVAEDAPPNYEEAIQSDNHLEWLSSGYTGDSIGDRINRSEMCVIF